VSGSRKGWDLAQLRTSFLADPEFQRLRRACRSDQQFLAAVGLWTIAVAEAWREDDGDVADVLKTYPAQAEKLGEAELVADGHLRGFEAWVGRMRARREADAARKRGAKESDGVRATPAESSGVQREERRGRGEEENEG
jgi:hypothetical protein